ncbi:F-box/LRR-repeat protein 6 [Anguilla anguilla]|uniref:F-box/LRR-repeat protein 6 n=1 Tax=Anguilla anguilla TaxID=7936 RepID=UPI0015AF9E87|nr:F-box/LRR-repeat protein 6 [Anguilla anguilla]
MEEASHNVSKLDRLERGEEILPNEDYIPPSFVESAGPGDSDSCPPGTSGRGDRAGSKKRSVKMKSSIKIGKTNKRKKVNRTPSLGYTIQQGEDMLLIISNDPTWKVWKRKKTKEGRSKLRTARVKRETSKVGVKGKVNTQNVKFEAAVLSHEHEAYDRWGQNLPVEVLVNIFKLVVKKEGPIPFLCRAARVCHLWSGAATHPVLWSSVAIGYCWIEPGKTQSPKMQLKVQDTIRWLAENRFSQLREFHLCHWKKHVDYVVQVVSQHCPQLSELMLSHCSVLTEKAFQNLGKNCPSLESINMQHSEVQVEGLVSFLEMHGSQIRKILFSYGAKSDRLLTALAGGCCPELKLLEINTKLNSGYCQLPICIQALQSGCPKLQVFRMLNVTAMPKTARRGPCSASGFPLLEELCIASSSMSFIMDQDLITLLHGSPRLRVLDLRGCARITAMALSTLPCQELECLFWGLYSSSNSMTSSKKGIHLLTEKWSHTLQELDLSSQPFSEQDLEVAMGNLAHSTGADGLRSLNLSGTKITSNVLRSIISHCSELNYLNLSSCRYLPRGLKRVYRSQEDIQQLLDKLPLTR